MQKLKSGYALNQPVTLTAEDVVGFDIETFGQIKNRLHRNTEGRLACVQVAVKDKVYIYTDPGMIRTILKQLPKVKHVVGHNLVYDFNQLRRWYTIEPLTNVWDLFLVEKNLWAGLYDDFSLADLARRYLQIHLDKSIRDKFADGEQLTEEMMQYAAEDARVSLAIYYEQLAEYDRDFRNSDSYWLIDAPMIWVVLDMLPIKIDVPGWSKLSDWIITEVDEKERALGFNSKSTKDSIRALNEVIHGVDFQATGTGKKVLAEFDDEDLVQELLEARKFRDAKSKYGYKWLESWVEPGNLVYPSWYITEAKTGRMSCRNPNIQQIPARTWPQFRDLILSNRGVLTVADMSQQEPRILACESGDKNLREIFYNHQDIHLEVARASFKDPTIEKHDERRKDGKTIGLAINYGMSAKSLAAKLGIPLDEAEGMLRNYYARFPRVASWQDRTWSNAQRNGFVETSAGRRSYLNLYSHQARRNSINTPCQGGGADLTKLWIIKIWERARKDNMIFPLCAIIHDEIILDHPVTETEYWETVLVDCLNDAAAQIYPAVPFETEAFTGDKWSCKK